MGLVLIWHFGMTFLYVAPWNPAYDKSASVVEGYMNPYFGQNWELFAPDPIDYNARVLVRAKVKDASGWERHTGWLDMTGPERKRALGSLFPGRVSRVVGGSRQLMTDADVPPSAASLPKQEETEGPETETVEEKPVDLVLQDQAVRHMRAIATLAARAEWGDGVTAVQVRISDHLFPRFEDKDRNGKGTKTYSDFDWWQPVAVSADAVRMWKEAYR
ncbi:DUF5819 family protein [Rhizohabitans arisaemae]|uniref:DUF5819 family protein n=1 Tax=Rhizohabitans arisaemae TaxID=2720610 RepID=UPI0024B25CCF|nr:DUF5819 family protein [Rhizohabitans arisaemae]